MSTKQYVFVVFIFTLSILGAFYSGFFLKNTLRPERENSTQNSKQLFRPNFIDEIIVITKEKPRKALVLSAIRTFVNENTNNYTIKTFFYDGEKWSKEIREGKSKELENIPSTEIVPKWEIINDPSYMLKQSVNGEIYLNDKTVKFNVPNIENEIGVRSFYKYTKFMSETDGILEIDGKIYDAKIIYSRIYSFNPPESLVFTTDPAGIETEWSAFWDQNDNFYSIDETVVDNKITNDVYKAHSLAILKKSGGSILKSFELNLNKLGEDKYSVDILGNIKTKIVVEKQNFINKAVNGIDIWNTGMATGFITNSVGQKLDIFGIYESISQ